MRALKASGVQVHWGRHRLDHRRAPRFVAHSVVASRDDKVDIWNLEEKETDVRLGIEMYRTVARQFFEENAGQRIEQLVLVSGDTDMTPALEAIRADFPDMRIGVILPHNKESGRVPAGSLRKNAHWMRRSVSEEELEKHQFPSRVHTHKKPADKPCYW